MVIVAEQNVQVYIPYHFYHSSPFSPFSLAPPSASAVSVYLTYTVLDKTMTESNYTLQYSLYIVADHVTFSQSDVIAR